MKDREASRYWLRRLGNSLIVIWGVSTLVFATLRLVPGDPVESILGETAQEVDKESLRQCLDLHHSIWTQYWIFLKEVAGGTFGELCDERGVTVMSKLIDAIPATIELAVASLIVAAILAIPSGVWAALRRGKSADTFTAVVSLMGISIPNFWLGPMLLILFSLTLAWLPDPGAGMEGVSGLILPAFTLGTALAAKLSRMTRSSVLEVLEQDYVRTARAKGLSEKIVIGKHVLRNSMIPVVTIMGLQFGALLAGAIVVEKVFARPGLGTLLLEGIFNRNYRLVQGCVLVIAFANIFVNLLTDLVYTWIDPRVKLR